MALSSLTSLNKFSVVLLCSATSFFGVTSSAHADTVSIMSRAVCPKDIPLVTGNVGHVAIAFHDGRGKLIGTKGMWPGGVRENDSADIDMAKGKGCGLRTRTAVVSSSRRQWIWNQVATSGGTNCQSYFAVGKVLGLSDRGCSCVGFATRVWRQVTNDWERWQLQLTPKLLGDTIQRANSQQLHGWFDNGKEWK